MTYSRANLTVSRVMVPENTTIFPNSMKSALVELETLIEENVLSVVASTWPDDTNAEKTDGYDTVDEIEDMEGDWEVIDEIGDSDEGNEEPRMVIVKDPLQDYPSFEASRLVVVEEEPEQDALEQEIQVKHPSRTKWGPGGASRPYNVSCTHPNRQQASKGPKII